MLLNLYTNNVAHVSWNGIQSKNFPVRNGVRQGGILVLCCFASTLTDYCVCCVSQALDVILDTCLWEHWPMLTTLPCWHLGWWRGPAVEHWSLADVLSLSCARLVADG